MLDRTETTERVVAWRERYARVRADFVAGRSGEETFRADLRRLGYLGREISSEVNLALMDRTGRSSHGR